MSSSERRPKVAYMEDEDEDGNAIEDSKTYAASTAPSPTKEKPNTSRTRRDRSRRDSSSPANGLTDSDSTVHPSSAVKRESKMKSRDKERDREREREKPSSSKKQVVVRPPITKHSKTVPNLQSSSYRRSHDESSYYGVNPVISSASSRPRAHTANPRPNSYYGGTTTTTSRPPLSNVRYHQYPPQPPAGALPTSFPPQPWAAAGPVSYPAQPSPGLPPQPVDYFAARPNNPLSARFNRPASAMGYRPPPTIAYGNDYDQENDNMPLIRRVSLNSKKVRDEEDRVLMPPPPRPSTTVTMRPSPFAPPPAPSRRTVGFDDDAFAGDSSLYRDVTSPLTRYDWNQGTVTRARRPSVGAPTVSYDVGSYRTEVAGRSSRRNSYYGEQSVSSGSGYEDKMRSATTYQHEVEGGPTMPLTAETLRKANKNSKTSSRSTRSSGSHDESDFRQSNTTHTTRSSNDEDITIRVKGAATFKVGNAEVECKDGAEININSRTAGTVRGGSDRDGSIYDDDRRTRITRPPTRTRASSQAGSYTRTAPPLYDPYGYPAFPYRPAAPPPEWL